MSQLHGSRDANLPRGSARRSADRSCRGRFLRHGANDAGARALEAYDRFIGLLHHPPSRQSLKELSREEADESTVYAEARRIGGELEGSLLSLLFETDELRGLVREFGIF